MINLRDNNIIDNIRNVIYVDVYNNIICKTRINVKNRIGWDINDNIYNIWNNIKNQIES